MSIIHSTNDVDLIDCASGFGISPWYKLKQNDFILEQPYFRAKSTQDDDDTKASRRPKKKQRINSTTDIQTQERHDELLPFLQRCMDHISCCWQDAKTDLTEAKRDQQTVSLPETTLEQQQKDEADRINFPDWISMALASRRFQHHDKVPLITLEQEQQKLDLLDLFNRVVKNESLVCRNINLGDHGNYIIPPQSDFLMGDLENIHDLVSSDIDKTYDLIVMDPPWPNKSVHRSSHYETQDIYDLYQIPLSHLAHPGTLIAVWITNKPKYRRFIIDKLFKSSNVTCVAEWTWIKVTNRGEPVFPLDSTHRKPYEQLVIGRYHGDDCIKKESALVTTSLPYQHAITSVPSKRHSRKPPLQDVLGPYLPSSPRCLELFARCLTPGWSSWGNECLKFQHESYYTKIDK